MEYVDDGLKYVIYNTYVLYTYNVYMYSTVVELHSRTFLMLYVQTLFSSLFIKPVTTIGNTLDRVRILYIPPTEIRYLILHVVDLTT